MRAELEEKLENEFPFMRRGKNRGEQIKEFGTINDLYGAFGCSCGDGWYELLRSLCSEIAAAYRATGLPEDIKILQVKEKFGRLRFYYRFGNEDCGISTIDFSDGCSIRLPKGHSDLHQKIKDIVMKWEEESANICMCCGSPGRLRTDISWIQTLCDECYDDYLKKR